MNFFQSIFGTRNAQAPAPLTAEQAVEQELKQIQQEEQELLKRQAEELKRLKERTERLAKMKQAEKLLEQTYSNVQAIEDDLETLGAAINAADQEINNAASSALDTVQRLKMQRAMRARGAAPAPIASSSAPVVRPPAPPDQEELAKVVAVSIPPARSKVDRPTAPVPPPTGTKVCSQCAELNPVDALDCTACGSSDFK